jgi:hypothetical protein
VASQPSSGQCTPRICGNSSQMAERSIDHDEARRAQ